MDIVITADDFGYSADTVETTVDALERGIVTGASLMVGMPATREAVEFARGRPDLTFGAHLVFVRDGVARPQRPPTDVPHLVDRGGRYRNTNSVRADALLRRLPVDEIERELESQLAFLVENGVPVRYVDSHRHVHKLPTFQTALRHVLPRFGIERVRGAQDIYLQRRPLSPTFWFGGRWRRALSESFATTDHTYMPHGDGDDWPERLLSRLDSLAGGSIEVGIHPGRDETWRRAQAESVESFAGRAPSRGHRLVAWAAISSTDRLGATRH